MFFIVFAFYHKPTPKWPNPMKQTQFQSNPPHLRNTSQNLGKSNLQHSGKSGHREEHRNEHQEHHEVSGQNTPGQDENIQGQPETSGRMAELLVGSKQEKLDKKRKFIPKEEATAIKYEKPSLMMPKGGEMH